MVLHSISLHSALRLIPILLIALFFAAPLPYRPPIFETAGRLPFDRAAPSPSASPMRAYEFRLTEARPDITVRFSSDLSRGWMDITFAGDEKHSATWGLKGRDVVTSTFSFGRDFRPGRYRLRVESHNAEGTFRASILGSQPWQYHQKLYISLAVALGVLAVQTVIARRRAGAASPRVRKLVAMAYILGFGLLLSLLYPIIHEAGHALPMLCFGAFSLRGTDFIGAWGAPHVNYLPGVTLQPWQLCIVAIAGPLLPTLVGWLLLVVWAVMRRTRGIAATPEAALLWVAGVLMVGQAGALIPILGLASDGDYTGFVRNLPAPLWMANAVHLGLLAANVWCLTVIVRRLLQIGRALRERISSTSRGAQAS